MDNEKEEQRTFESYKEQIDIWYRAHNIIREKSELYYDFLSSLLNIIDETYLGSDVIRTDEDMMNHFYWCYNKVISNFEQERIMFIPIPKSTHYEYLWLLFYKSYYTSTTENKVQILHDYFKLIFDFNKVKTSPEIEVFIDLYKILDQNLKKIN
jgi:hypothetical protein